MLFGRSACCIFPPGGAVTGTVGAAGCKQPSEKVSLISRGESHMRSIFSRALAVLAITAVAALGADNSIGSWKVNIAKSKYTPAPIPVKSLTSVREAAPNGVKVTVTGELADGAAINATYTAKYDGVAVAVTGSGAPYDSISIKQVNANTLTYEAKQTNGKYNASGRTVISKDGKTMTTTAKGTDTNGAAMTLKLVYDKQ
jgi:hypothetical protein